MSPCQLYCLVNGLFLLQHLLWHCLSLQLYLYLYLIMSYVSNFVCTLLYFIGKVKISCFHRCIYFFIYLFVFFTAALVKSKTVLNGLTQVINFLMDACPSQSCRNKCNVEYNYDEHICSLCCKCDPLCAQMGDCCLDYFYFCHYSANTSAASVPLPVEESIVSLAQHYLDVQEDLNLRDLMTCTPIPGISSYFVIDKCLESFTNSNVISSCINPGNDSLIKQIYAFVENYGIFRNLFCVQCHNIDITQACTFSMQLKCGTSVAKLLREVVGNSNPYVEAAILKNCLIWYGHHINNVDSRKEYCKIDESYVRYKCNLEHASQELLEINHTQAYEYISDVLCATFKMPMVTWMTEGHFLKETLKNPFCLTSSIIQKKGFKCYDQTIDKPFIFNNNNNQSQSNNIANFAALFNLGGMNNFKIFQNLEKNRQLYQIEVCPIDSFPNYFTRECQYINNSSGPPGELLIRTVNDSSWTFILVLDLQYPMEVNILMSMVEHLLSGNKSYLDHLNDTEKILQHKLNMLFAYNIVGDMNEFLAHASSCSSQEYHYIHLVWGEADIFNSNYLCFFALFKLHHIFPEKTLSTFYANVESALPTLAKNLQSIKSFFIYNYDTSLHDGLYGNSKQCRATVADVVYHEQKEHIYYGEIISLNKVYLHMSFYMINETLKANVYTLVCNDERFSAQDITSLVCSALSVLFLSLTLVIYGKYEDTHTSCSINIVNLSLSILLAQLVFIVGIQIY